MLILISKWFYTTPCGNLKFSEKTKTSLKYPFFDTGVVKHFNQGQPLRTNRNYLVLIPPNIKSILKDFAGSDHNYGSICVFLWPKVFGKFLLYSRKMSFAQVKKDAGPSKLRWGYKKQMRWLTLTVNSCVKSIWYPYPSSFSLEGQY